MSWWDLNSREGEETAKEYTQRVKYEAILAKRVESFRGIVDNDLEEGQQIRIITEKGFNAISVIEYFHESHDMEEVWIAVYRMNIRAVRKLKQLISEKDLKVTILLSSFFRENKKYEQWCADLVEFARSNEKAKVFYAWSHAKVFLARTKCGKHIVFEGSGNLSDNARIEQYILENNKTVFEFHKNWIKEVIANEN